MRKKDKESIFTDLTGEGKALLVQALCQICHTYGN